MLGLNTWTCTLVSYMHVIWRSPAQSAVCILWCLYLCSHKPYTACAISIYTARMRAWAEHTVCGCIVYVRLRRSAGGNVPTRQKKPHTFTFRPYVSQRWLAISKERWDITEQGTNSITHSLGVKNKCVCVCKLSTRNWNSAHTLDGICLQCHHSRDVCVFPDTVRSRIVVYGSFMLLTVLIKGVIG